VVALAESVARDLRCDAGFDVRVMEDLGSSFLTGIARPIIVLPERMVGASERGELSGVLAHELTYVRANGVTWLLLNRVVCSVLWFHPLAWLGRAAHSAA
jgi:beta-lactamase regulating signal transducer with metallopeptidase domain